MSDHNRIPEANTPEGELPDALRWQLRALRRDAPPTRDLWPAIAARLVEQAPSVAAQTPAAADGRQAGAPVTALRPRERTRHRWMAPLALAASVAALAIGIAGQYRAEPGSSPSVAAQPSAPASLMQREADGMTRQYQAAIREIGPATERAKAMQPAFDELDRNAALILDALAHDPDSRLLLEQLRRTYARRLALAQRVVYT
ncbi:hypothetical protein [Lysobacter sp. 1R34A]|uniref:hypothetical protein n=1 Tax=Lysobacter sp. 1R34A TaxID=3445786 RepID=UPI003EEF604E